MSNLLMSTLSKCHKNYCNVNGQWHRLAGFFDPTNNTINDIKTANDLIYYPETVINPVFDLISILGSYPVLTG